MKNIKLNPSYLRICSVLVLLAFCAAVLCACAIQTSSDADPSSDPVIIISSIPSIVPDYTPSQTYVPPSTEAAETEAPSGERPTELVSSTPSGSPTEAIGTSLPTETPVSAFRAVYLGILGQGRVTAAEVMRPGAKLYRFLVNGEEKLFSVSYSSGFPIQNVLMEGYEYTVTADIGEIVSAVPADAVPPYSPPVSSTPGKRTLKNFLATSLAPLGTTLYVYGGGWNWQDDGASVQTRSIGVPGTWARFFASQNANYEYRRDGSPESSYYPYGGYNEYWYAGLDCSGFVGWAVYNTLETESGRSGYVFGSTEFAKTLASVYGLGTWSDEAFESGGNRLMPGDIVSMPGHVYICIGRCADDSIVILHSTVSESVSGKKGGGVQLSAVDPHGNGKSCEAYRLCSYYQNKYYPEWSARYPASMRSFSQYIGFTRTGMTGVFRWYRNGSGLADPDGYSGMTADEILSDLFGQ